MIDESEHPIDVMSMSLWQRIFAIQAEGTRVEKKGRNEDHMYNYARAQDIVATAQKLFARWRVVPQITYSIVGEGLPDKQFVTRLVATLTLVNPDDPEERVVWGTFPGTGQDTGDKGTYKAMTGAAKYAYIMACLFEPSDDPEDSGKRKRVKKAANKPIPASAPTGTNGTSPGEPGKLSGEMPKDSNSFWKEIRAAGLFQVARDKIEHHQMTWQEIWKELTQPAMNGKGNGKQHDTA